MKKERGSMNIKEPNIRVFASGLEIEISQCGCLLFSVLLPQGGT